MKLHLDTDAFKTLLDNIHEKTGYRTDVLEKDYYVVLILKELSQFQKDGLPAYFKGPVWSNRSADRETAAAPQPREASHDHSAHRASFAKR